MCGFALKEGEGEGGEISFRGDKNKSQGFST